ncbi:AMP-binding protein [Nocardia crassostreae]|uniref:AMP-binding protein n=1 Tax=Nocardia crassostreae TaxID=53428 RepID=UPI00082D2181|nr:AMP-binding protein [Nocardia crassostreae]
MTALETELALGVSLIRSRVLWPVAPKPLLRMGLALLDNGANPAVLLAISSARWPDRTAIEDDLGQLDYAGLSALAAGVAGGLRSEHGVGPGSAVAVMCRNSRYFVAGLFGALTTGADTVLLNTEFHTEALSRAMARHRVAAVVCDAECEPMLRAAGYDGPVLRCLDAREDDGESAEAWRRRGLRAPARVPAGRLVILTSGTTGTPKGVPRAPKVTSVTGTAASLLRRTGLRTGSVVAVSIPMFHGFGLGMTLLGIALGGTLVLRRRFDAVETLAAVAGRRVRLLAVVPVMLQRILAVPSEFRAGFDLSSLRVVLSGAAPLSPTLATESVGEFGALLYNGYGSSEVGIGALATPEDLRDAPGTVGRPVLGTEVRILDDAHRRVPAGTTGHVFVGGGLGFAGYSGGGDKHRVDGLIDSGDLGYLDPHGRLFIVGRADDMIVSGGENVYPQQVEEVLAAHPRLRDVAVIGVDDAEFGQRLAAFAVPAAGSAVDAEQLQEYLRPKVSRYQRPREIRVVTEIPRNPTGKLDRGALRSLLQPHDLS